MKFKTKSTMIKIANFFEQKFSNTIQDLLVSN